MGRFSPTVLPRYPHKPGIFERIGDIADEVLPYWEARQERKAAEEAGVEAQEARDLELAQEGIFRGRALPADVEIAAPTETMEARLPGPESDVMEDSLSRGRQRTSSLYDRFADEDLGIAEPAAQTAPGGATGARTVEPGAYNPIRGAFEPAFPVGGESVTTPAAGIDATVPNTRQLTENYYVDEDRTPSGRESQRQSELLDAAIEAGLLAPEDRTRAAIVGTEDAVGYRDDEREAATNTEANRSAHAEYVENLRAVTPDAPAPPFSDDINWARENVELARDVRNERQIRTRPTRGSRGGAKPMTGSDARRFINNIFGGERRASTAAEGAARIPKDTYESEPVGVSAAKVLGPVDFERLADALESGEISREAVQANAPKIAAGKLDEVLAGGAVAGGTPAAPPDQWSQVRREISGMSDTNARALLVSAGYSDPEIEEIMAAR